MHIRRNSGLSTTRIDLKMCESVKQSKISEPYLITRDDEASEILQERLFRERRDLIIKGIVGLGRRLVVPFVGLDRQVVLLGVLLAKMPSQFTVPRALCVEIIGYTLGNIVHFVAISFAASLLDGRIVIRNAVLTCITCRPSAPCLGSLRRLEIRVQ